MGYRIAYSPEDNRRYPMHKRYKIKRKWIIPVAAFLILTAVLFSRVDALRRFLLPGDPDVTQAAITTMVEDLKTGEPLYDTVTAFCREIIQNAGIR